MHFGEHLTIDGYGGEEILLNDKKIVERIFSELPELLGMHTICDPVVVFAPANDIKDPGGWSGFVMIAESHISVHTFPARGFVSIDVYTCQNGLDIEKIKDYFKEAFNLKEEEVNFIKRGLRYPQNNIYG
ncbi:MAG: S-adenosylmethionine decarboxylase proenzyme [Parcubacteria group bacterium]|nr:S-adenosylmethionine decarboxylase proenzyme [Parcubacteria group bacterium]